VSFPVETDAPGLEALERGHSFRHGEVVTSHYRTVKS
jgi:hypothetical protein